MTRPPTPGRMQGGEKFNPYHLLTRERAMAHMETLLTIVGGDLAYATTAQPPE